MMSPEPQKPYAVKEYERIVKLLQPGSPEQQAFILMWHCLLDLANKCQKLERRIEELEK